MIRLLAAWLMDTSLWRFPASDVGCAVAPDNDLVTVGRANDDAGHLARILC